MSPKKKKAIVITKDVKHEVEWLFPGSAFVDGTIEGAMQAGLEAYSV